MRSGIPEELKANLKSCPVDFRSAENFLKRARKDLSSARLIRSSDVEGSYAFLYNCMLHAGLAYMAASGLRPDVRGKHKTVVQYMTYALGKGYQDSVHFYDRMRRKRHLLIYEPGRYGTSRREIEEAEKVARDFLAVVSKAVRERNPQMELDIQTE